MPENPKSLEKREWHPTGRLISKREGYDVDIARLIELAKEDGVALEINAYWDRLDLNDLDAKRSKERGVKLAINTDAHDLDGMEQMKFGVGTARRGWIEKKDLINTYSYTELIEWLNARR